MVLTQWVKNGFFNMKRCWLNDYLKETNIISFIVFLYKNTFQVDALNV